MPTLDQLKCDYLRYAKVELGHTADTFRSYQSGLNRFLRWLEEELGRKPELTDFTTEALRNYRYSLEDLRPRTVRGLFHPLRGIDAFLVERGLLGTRVSLTIRMPKKDAPVREVISQDKINRLFAASDLRGWDQEAAMNRAVIATLIFGAVRRQELLDLELLDVDVDNGSLVVRRGKGNKRRTVYPAPEWIDAMRRWLDVRPSYENNPWLFTVDKRRRMGVATMKRLIERVANEAGLGSLPCVKPHSIRHAAATRLLRNGADLLSIQTFLGHSDVKTTAIYLHTDEEQLRKISKLGSLNPAAGVEGVESKPRAREEVARNPDKPRPYALFIGGGSSYPVRKEESE